MKISSIILVLALVFSCSTIKGTKDINTYYGDNFFYIGSGKSKPGASNMWVRDYKQEGDQSFPGKGQIKSSEEELRALRKELLHVRQERDILKKAVAIFSGPQGKGINS